MVVIGRFAPALQPDLAAVGIGAAGPPWSQP